MFSNSLASLALLATCTIASPIQQLSERATVSQVTDIWDFPKATWVENLAVRSNGQILNTHLTAPELWTVDPTKANAAKLVHSFSGYIGLLGITEVQADVFYVVAGNYSIAAGGVSTPGSYAIWKADMTKNAFSKVADVPQGQFLNGVTALGTSAVLVADSIAGAIWKVDVNTGAVTKAITDPILAPDTTQANVLGVNGVSVKGSTVYVTNTNKGTYGKIPINSAGSATGAGSIISSGLTGADDLLVQSDNSAQIAGNNQLRSTLPTSGGTVLSSDALLAGSTAVKFGRRSADSKSVYVSTNGGTEQYVNKSPSVPGRIVRVDFA
ncbi:MAG: hypothetical protein MMC23_006687 [Stictis urceolatum]|nr:hypothetical protein [Stictis urceolata]